MLAVCIGVAGYALFHRRAEASGIMVVTAAGQLQSATNELAATEEAIASLHDQIQNKREWLRQASPPSNITPELLELLESRDFRGHDRAWAQLREQLGIGWDASPDYVLVSKQAIKDVWYDKLKYAGSTVSDDSVNLLNLSPEEKSAVKAALARAMEGQWTHVENTPPAGDVVAEITIVPPDPAFDAAASNAFTADIISIIGDDRASLFLNDAWRELRGDLAPSQPKTLTIRQTTTDGQADLVCEIKEGDQVSTAPVRYGNYPNFPVMQLFPGGWQAMANTMNFDLPPSFFPPNFRQ